jgi:hypothetical protein
VPLDYTSADYNFTLVQKHIQVCLPTYFELKSSQKERFPTQKVAKSFKYILVSKKLQSIRVFIIANMGEVLGSLSLSKAVYYFGE